MLQSFSLKVDTVLMRPAKGFDVFRPVARRRRMIPPLITPLVIREVTSSHGLTAPHHAPQLPTVVGKRGINLTLGFR